MFAIDILLKDEIGARLADLRARPNLVDQIFKGTSGETRAQIKAYLATAAIEVRLGWVQATTHMPCIAITLPAQQEGQQMIGSDPGSVYDSDLDDFLPSNYVEDGTFYEEQSTPFTGSADLAIYATNGSECAWLAAILTWIALRARPALEDAGLVEQRLTVTDFMPASDYPQPDPAYTRVVKIAYTSYVEYLNESDDPNDTATPHSVAVDMEND